MIDYFLESEKYKPSKVNTLLIGEAPPPSGERYFYVPMKLDIEKDITQDSSLPSTIFYHYFKKRPKTNIEYVELLTELQSAGIFLMDIIDRPLKIRNDKDPSGVNVENLMLLIGEIPELKKKIKARNIIIDEKSIIFLLARPHYKRELLKEFPNSTYTTWKDFRIR